MDELVLGFENSRKALTAKKDQGHFRQWGTERAGEREV